jgi:predicted transport protein
MPQNVNLSAKWRESLGLDWKRVQHTFLHILDNLILTGYNAEYSDRPFAKKRDLAGGFMQSPLRLNEGLGPLEDWNEEQIGHRAERLAGIAAHVWEAPSLAPGIVDAYRPAVEKTIAYRIDHYPQLRTGTAMRSLFEAFRKEVLALDPLVTEEFLKVYIAHKAETNFVDVMPQAKRLRLSLNMHFHEIHDPKALCKDVTNLGREGNGDVEVGLASPDELPYVIGLVRQALEKQMGNSEEAG